jgi:hypothetical protein
VEIVEEEFFSCFCCLSRKPVFLESLVKIQVFLVSVIVVIS